MILMHSGPVLYAEDEDNDVFLLQRAFRKAGVVNPLQVATDGAEAIRYLEGAGEFSDRRRFPLPCLILLDLNLPRRSGLEILKWVRDHPKLHTLPVVIFSSSSQARDVRAAFALGASGYLVKPASPEKLIDVVSSLRDSCLHGHVHHSASMHIRGSLRPPATASPTE